MISFLNWFYWNPSREAFKVPFLDHPVAWYGILFVLGFFISYLVINPILARFLRHSKVLSALDILDWNPIKEALQSSSSSLARLLWQELDIATKTKLKTLEDAQPLDHSIKENILKGLNHLLHQPQLSREDLEQAFPHAIATVKQTSYLLTDRLCWFVVVGTVVGARLGEVLFYGWPYYQTHPMEIFKIWKGGLASHGGTLGVVISLYLYSLYIQKWIPKLNFLRLLDYVAIPSALVAFFIRLGNFVNQEILGIPTSFQWAVIFGDPADGSLPIPRHPVQLYEGISYLFIFIFLYSLWYKRGEQLRPGIFCGLLFVFVFSSRFILEFWKTPQSSFLDFNYLQAGQLLSIPFIVVGWLLILCSPDGKDYPLSKSSKSNSFI